MSAARPVVEGVFTEDPPALLGARCSTCTNHHFPRLDQCPYCGHAPVEPVALTGPGTLWGWTTVMNPPPGYLGTVPYGFGVVELPEGLRVVTRLAVPTDAWTFGQPMQLRIVELGSADDGGNGGGGPVSTWEFTA